MKSWFEDYAASVIAFSGDNYIPENKVTFGMVFIKKDGTSEYKHITDVVFTEDYYNKLIGYGR